MKRADCCDSHCGADDGNEGTDRGGVRLQTRVERAG